MLAPATVLVLDGRDRDWTGANRIGSTSKSSARNLMEYSGKSTGCPVEAAPSDFRPLRFSASDLPEKDRVAAWREFFGPSVFRTDIDPARDVQFRADVTLRLLPDLCLVWNVMSPARFQRTPKLAGDGNDQIGLVVAATGGTASQRRRELEAHAGEAFIMNAAEPGAFVSPAPLRCFHLHIPRALLAPFVVDLDGAALRPIPRSSEPLRYLLNYVSFLRTDRTLSDPHVARIVVVHLRDVIALMLGATAEAAVIAQARGLRAARLKAIMAFVSRKSADQRLTLQAVAGAHRVTPRYVQRLFEAEGTTFSAFLLNQRLANAHRILTGPGRDGRSVSAIALEAGFGDISYFNRCFRRRFSASPSDVRAQHLSRLHEPC
jgi:AraC-like DNA-binding protein